jgi:hypothetical protein
VTPLSCSELEDVAAELALGILPGDQRAGALAHLDRCHGCQQVVENLAHAVDTIVAATPAVSPPRSFSRRLTQSFMVRRRLRWRRTVVSSAAAVALALALTVAAPWPDNGSVPARPVTGAALTAPGVRMARLAPLGDERIAGVVFVQPSQPSWILMAVSDDEKDSTYACELEYIDGRSVRAGTFAIRSGGGTWRQDLPSGSPSITRVTVLTPDGIPVARASFR